MLTAASLNTTSKLTRESAASGPVHAVKAFRVTGNRPFLMSPGRHIMRLHALDKILLPLLSFQSQCFCPRRFIELQPLKHSQKRSQTTSPLLCRPSDISEGATHSPHQFTGFFNRDFCSVVCTTRVKTL
ncbi:hypothetical protein TRVL_07670 [Trypanosoma vivax]|nr:hypothetical protein TRVL_07670 [Trypanosoma vivax]